MTDRTADVVICGAGIAGVAAAYMLAAQRGLTEILIVDERPPLTLTSDKSTECYRNWWPGPGDAMVAMMNRSIDLMEEMARGNGNSFHLNRRGYLYVTQDEMMVSTLEQSAEEASMLGAGPLRKINGEGGGTYQPAPAEGFEDQPDGADLITDPKTLAEYFPYLSEETAAALHVRRAGWLSAQQYGMYLLEEARHAQVVLVEGRVTKVEVEGGRVRGVVLADGSRIHTPVFINAAGPMLAEVGQMLGVDIPVYNELHLKASVEDPQGILSREAPMVISADKQTLPWDAQDRALLREDPETSWLTDSLPAGAHSRPEGGLQAQTVLMLWDVHQEEVEPVLPPLMDPMYAELALRGQCKMIPGMKIYLDRLPKAYVDGGYYTRTRENRPLAGPLPVEGAYVIGAMAGYGIMAAAGLAELLADHITESEQPSYASAFDLKRYQDAAYQGLLENWGATWQL